MIIKTALDYREDTLDLHFKEKEDTHARLQFSSCDLDDDNLIVQKTKTNTLDNIIEKLPFKRIDLLKLDLEGFDHYALLGARKTLMNQQIGAIQFEVTRFWENSACSPCATFRLLNKNGFEVYFIKNTGLLHLKSLDNYPHFSLYSNFCAIHSSQL